MKIKFIKIKAKQIFTKTGIPGAKWVLNQYVGCEHACPYCYAKFMGRWRPKNYGKWGNWVEVKENASELVKGKYVDSWVYMSSVSDPYQPIEKKLKITRKVLENLDKRIKLAILTKSDLVLRDIDLFKKFKNIEVGLTINSFDSSLKKVFEPFSSKNEDRIKALKVLKENGIRTYTFISPIIPGLINLKDVIRKTKNLTDYYWFEMINMKLAGREFIKILRKESPESLEVVTNKRKFEKFVKECKNIINSEDIKVRGIEIH